MIPQRLTDSIITVMCYASNVNYAE